MLVGIDFDNTIVCYGALFHRAAVTKGWIPPETPADKEQVRNVFRRQGQEDRWTLLQGQVYGELIREAPPFPGVLGFLDECCHRGIAVCIVSHKTRLPIRGPAVDLHQAAFDWLKGHRIHTADGNGLPLSGIYFEETKQRKLQRIAEVGCECFIDDLPEFLAEPDFPPNVQRILFDPHRRHQDDSAFVRADSWTAIQALIQSRLPS